ncbi:MAG: LamG domain-containing protein [Armatimonadota bacterium]
MARPQMLYVGVQGALTYEAIGNVQTGDGCKGTLSLWYHPSSEEQRGSIVVISVDTANALSLSRTQQTWYWGATSGGVWAGLSHVSGTVAWRHVVATWDFSGGPGHGVLRLYLDGVEVPSSPVTTASAPVGPPATICVGPTPDNTYSLARAVYDQMTIWDGAMTAEQVAALHALGQRHRPRQEDGSGRLLFGASWDGQYDAHSAEGSPTASFLGAADQYCRLDVGSRHRGKRFSYRIGMPAHDGSDDDRVPVMALLQRTKYGLLVETNTDEYGQLDLDGSNNAKPIGASLAPWLPAPAAPMTLRAGLHVKTSTAPTAAAIAVGAHSYVMGTQRRFVCGAGCTLDTLYSTDLTEADGFWAGAELLMLTGAAKNQKLKVLSNSQSAHTLTLDGQLSDAPASGDIAVVVFPRRVEPFQTGGSLYPLECDLSESHEGIERFAVLETAICGTWGYSCINLGRLQLYPFTVASGDVFFGKRDWNLYSQWTCTLLIERLEMDGPGTCAVTECTDDTFLVTDVTTDDSVRVWRREGVERETRQPVQYASPAQIQESFTAAGSWRSSLMYCPSWMEYDPAEDRLRALLTGIDGQGVARVGWVIGQWSEELGRVVWEDDPDPRNPMFTLDELRAVLGGRSQPYQEIGMINGAFQTGEDEWALVFTATLGNPDGMAACALVGAPDRYSFDPAEHFDPALNPLTPAHAGNDKLVSEGSGIGLFGNRDFEPRFVANPWARRSGERFWGYARAKTINHQGSEVYYQLARPISCLVTGDFQNMRTLPWRNQIIAPVYGWFHWPHPEWYGPSTVGLVVDDGGVTYSHVTLYASEDGVHLRNTLGQPLIPRDTPPFNAGYLMPVSVPVRLGKRRLYWYRNGKSGNDFNMASIRLDGEALYRLSAGVLTGELQTCALRRTGATWDELRLNADPMAGTVKVAVVDAATGDPVPGYGYDDCDWVGEGVERRVTWKGAGLGEVSVPEIALRFCLTRPGVGDPSPELYAWMIAPARAADRPRVVAVRVEGQVNPARVADPRPDMAWEYEDRQGRPQSAYQVLVASTQEKLNDNQGDMWDSGVVLSAEQRAKYAGADLASERTYFWKVRVRNSEGVWSEEW